MPAPAVIESFCERCGTRYTFEPPRQRGRSLTSIGKTLGILSENGTPESASLTASRDPFHGMFHFCLECRQYTCPSCWNAEAGFCQGCYPLPESPDMLAAESAASTEATTHLIVALEEVRVASAPDAWPGADLRQPEPDPPAALGDGDAADAQLGPDGYVAAAQESGEASALAAASPETPGTSFEWIDPEPVAELTPADIARVGEAPTFTAMVAAAVAASLQAPQLQPEPEAEPSGAPEAAVEVTAAADEPETAVEVTAAADESPLLVEATADAADSEPPVTAVADAFLAEAGGEATVEPAPVAASMAEVAAPVAGPQADEPVVVEALVAHATMPAAEEASPAPRRQDSASDPEADAWLAMDAAALAATRPSGDAAPATSVTQAETVAPDVEIAALAPAGVVEFADVAPAGVVEFADVAPAGVVEIAAVAPAEAVESAAEPAEAVVADGAVAEPVAEVAVVAQAAPDTSTNVQEMPAVPAAYTNGHAHAAPHEHSEPDLDMAWAGLLAAAPVTDPETQPDELAADDWQALAPALGPDVAPVAPTAPAAPVPTAPETPQPSSIPAMPATPPVAWPAPAASAAPAAWQHTAPEVPGQPPAWRPYGTVYSTPSGGSVSGNGHLPTGVRPCHNCALPVSAQARFCRRCGQPQV